MSFPLNEDDGPVTTDPTPVRTMHRIELRAEEPAAAPRLVVAASGEWFQLDGCPVVHLETRASLRKLLTALAGLRARDADAELSVREAFAAGWPGERAHPDAAAVRVYTAIHSLRAFGLRGLLVRRSGGYALEVDVRIAAAESQFPHALLVDDDTIARAI
jgi:hypothetical protein